METVIHRIRDLSHPERRAAEQLVGHSLREDQQLVIQIVAVEHQTASADPAFAGASLPTWCNVYEGLSDAEVDKIEKSIVRTPGNRSFE